MRTLFLAIFQNAIKHGLNKESGREIIIYVEEDNLCISNVVDEKEKEEIEESISPKAYRIGEGISQAVIFDTCRSWYDKVHYDEMFVIEKEDNNSKNWAYVVKLPIIERAYEV